MNLVTKLQQIFSANKEENLSGRYIHNGHILPLINALKSKLELKEIGRSVLNKPIFSIKLGYGSKRILMWSQMHGNESTTTKAVFDLLNSLLNVGSTESILNNCRICIIPILNPDGAKAYTRLNANEMDLNRDAQNLSQPESRILRKEFHEFKPDYCFNLHGQRTIFSAGRSNNPATISFLAPAQDEARSISDSRKQAMEIIAVMNKALQKIIPNQVGVYDDTFNNNCVGDTFQSLNIPTILFEAGHYPNDYQREKSRELIFISLFTALNYIANNSCNGENYSDYLNIPENKKLFFDIILRNAKLDGKITDIAIQYEEKLKNGNIEFIKTIKKTGILNGFFGHQEENLKNKEVKINKKHKSNDFEIDIVIKK